MIITITTAAKVRAVQLARHRVREQIRSQGLRPSSFTAREISVWAELYSSDHPELTAQARVEVTAWIKAGFMGKRAQQAALAAA